MLFLFLQTFIFLILHCYFPTLPLLVNLCNLGVFTLKSLFLTCLLPLLVFCSSGSVKNFKTSMCAWQVFIWQKLFIVKCKIPILSGIIARFVRYCYDSRLWLLVSLLIKWYAATLVNILYKNSANFLKYYIHIYNQCKFYISLLKIFIEALLSTKFCCIKITCFIKKYSNLVGWLLPLFIREAHKGTTGNFIDKYRPISKVFNNCVFSNHSGNNYTEKNKEKIIYTIFKSLFWCVPGYFNKLTLGLLKDNLIVYLSNSYNFLYFMFYLRESSRFSLKQIIDINCVDICFLKHNLVSRSSRTSGGYELYYFMLSLNNHFRLTLKSFVDRFASTMLSVTSLYSSTSWAEREMWDMFGVYFIGNKDHRRILTDYGFVGFPLRKSFPTTGFVEVYYSEILGKLRYVPVSFKQEFRLFFFNGD